MTTRVPIIPTVFVMVAVVTMIALGVWQLGRAEEKAELLARYDAASAIDEPAVFPVEGEGRDLWFRSASVNCLSVASIKAVAGTAGTGSKGWAHRASCVIENDTVIPVDIGFSRSLAVPSWEGGQVSGVIAPGPRLVADPPVAGLEPLARPDPSDLPNNHLAYAWQWFFFALTALLIYGFALRSRWRKRR